MRKFGMRHVKYLDAFALIKCDCTGNGMLNLVSMFSILLRMMAYIISKHVLTKA